MELKQLAKLGMRRRRTSTLAIIVVSTLSLVFILSLMVLQGSMQKTGLEQRKESYGSHEASVVTESRGVLEFLKNHAIISRVGVMKVRAQYKIKESAYGQIASLDKNAIKLGNLHLLEGSFPKRKGEIVVEMSTLSALGYSYEIGQKITLDLSYFGKTSKNRIEFKREYVLSGVLRDYSTIWKPQQIEYPSIFALDEELPNAREKNIILIDVKQKYYAAIEDLRVSTNASFQLNDATYYNWAPILKEWAILQSSSLVFLFLGMITSFFIFQIFSTEVERRKESFEVLRRIGAEISQLRKILFYEGLYIWGVAVIFGGIVGFAGAYLLIHICNRLFHLSIIFYFQTSYIIWTFVLVSISIWLGLLVPITGIRQIASPRHERISLFHRLYKKQRKQKKNFKFKKKEIWRRENKIHPLQYHFNLIICIITTLFIFTVVLHVGEQIKNYGIIGESDYRSGICGDWNNEKQTYPKADIQRLRQIYGISRVNTLRYSHYLPLHWENQENSEYAKVLTNAMFPYHQRTEGVYGVVMGIDKTEELFGYYQRKTVDSNIDADAFWKGEQVILYLPTLYLNENGELGTEREKNHFSVQAIHKEDTIKVGDTITIGGEHGEKTVKVGGIITSYQEFTYRSEASDSRYGIIASNLLLDQLEEPNEQKYYGYVEAFTNPYADYQTTDREVSLVMQKLSQESSKNGSLVNQRIEKEITLRNTITEVVTALLLLVSLLLLILVIQYNTMHAKAHRLKKKIGILRAIGLSKKELLNFYRWENIKIPLVSFLIALPIGVIAKVVINYRQLQLLDWGNTSLETTGVIDFMIKYVQPVISMIPWKSLICVCILFLGVLYLLTYKQFKKVVLEEIIKNIKG